MEYCLKDQVIFHKVLTYYPDLSATFYYAQKERGCESLVTVQYDSVDQCGLLCPFRHFHQRRTASVGGAEAFAKLNHKSKDLIQSICRYLKQLPG